MKEKMSFKFDHVISTGSSNYYTITSSAVPDKDKVIFVDSFDEIKETEGAGRYSIYEIADWFLNKGPMTQKKLQKLCYYAQAWNYALNNIVFPPDRSLFPALYG